MTAHHSVEGPFLVLLVLAHLQAIVVAWTRALASARGLLRLRERLPAAGGTCLGLAFAAFGKGAAIASQTLLLLVMLRLWWRSFADRQLWLYPMFTMGLTTLFGALLNTIGDQIWHLFIGPAGIGTIFRATPPQGTTARPAPPGGWRPVPRAADGRRRPRGA
ncbi:MAG: hypothetical protein QE276_03420 [Cyanobium sp. D14.bin.5]|jgi:hypothetical protein|nr:hypothetical protein [Cyanobium sp. D14.bin.5]